MSQRDDFDQWWDKDELTPLEFFKEDAWVIWQAATANQYALIAAAYKEAREDMRSAATEASRQANYPDEPYGTF